MSGIMRGFYDTLIRKNTVFLGTIFVSAFATEMIFDVGSNKIWDQVNKGVCSGQREPKLGSVLTNRQRQWKDIKQRYMEAQDDDDE
ncbi:hypothetical protein MBLNU230_g0862t1 [Neophaeotheca triangularis]